MHKFKKSSIIKNIPMVKKKIDGEDKHDKFRRIATDRTNKVLRKLRILGNCANKSSYEYTDEDVEKMFGAIDRELKRIKTLFNSRAKSETFSL